MEELAFPVVGIVGETASGKTAFSIALAKALGGPDHAEIISADAMQLYRGMDIGTAKATSDERGGIFHRQIDVLDVADEASVAAYQRESRADIRDITSKGKVALVVGGSGLYISAALDELDFPGTDPSLRRALEQRVANEGLGSLIDELTQKDPVSARTIDIHNPRRVIRALEVVCLTGRSYTPVFPPHTSHFTPTLMLGVRRERDVLNEAISQRAAAMFEHGLLEETAALLEHGLAYSATAKKATGYAQAIDVLEGRLSVQDAIESVAQATRRLAKKQRTWFKRDQRITWIDVTSTDGNSVKECIEYHARVQAQIIRAL
ncbi:tRNA (adenosine(37)-N6)-dimethylallyltransferase MiaA [Arcanobacterium canis]|uniref:tRNA dimethylallyltransferase n=1 Tax=Arcanobacterium canis TaxID=999183 RepID=A0ABY8FWC3_9ACTO|nr:tRNA (adenosine(37)-N6)-dimethylallyltransferase MiaA [Arcanobacterium canis]WFM82824.1 tRNA (adenosine(37)-N6)-dimethylallyltransferase MiaA [Arcanobacterium canis]